MAWGLINPAKERQILTEFDRVETDVTYHFAYRPLHQLEQLQSFNQNMAKSFEKKVTSFHNHQVNLTLTCSRRTYWCNRILSKTMVWLAHGSVRALRWPGWMVPHRLLAKWMVSFVSDKRSQWSLRQNSTQG